MSGQKTIFLEARRKAPRFQENGFLYGESDCNYIHILHLYKRRTQKPEIACAPRTQFRAFGFWCKM